MNHIRTGGASPSSVHPLAGVMSPGRPDRSPAPPQPSTLHPLAKAMEKKPKKQVQQSAETYADETVQSVSQKLRGQSMADSQRRKEDMEKHLREAEAHLVVMKDLLVEREKILKEAKEKEREKSENDAADEEAQQNKKDELGKKFTKFKSNRKLQLIDNAIPPYEQKRKNSRKKHIQQMREKLHQMETRTESYLADIENTMQYLGSLQDASENMGPLSDETQDLIDREGTDDFIAKVYAENVSEPRSAKSNKGQQGSESEDEEPEENQAEGDKKARESKVFITSMEREASGAMAPTLELQCEFEDEDVENFEQDT